MRRVLFLLALGCAACAQVEEARPETPQALAELVASGVAPGALPASAQVVAVWEPSGAAAVAVTLPDLATAEAFAASLPAPGDTAAPSPPEGLLRRADPGAGDLAGQIRSGAIQPVRRIGPDGVWVFACGGQRTCWAWRD